MKANVFRILLIATAVVFCLLLASGEVAAQCAMCRSSVPQALAKNFNLAVIVLLAPPVSIFSAIFFIAYKNRKG